MMSIITIYIYTLYTVYCNYSIYIYMYMALLRFYAKQNYVDENGAGTSAESSALPTMHINIEKSSQYIQVL